MKDWNSPKKVVYVSSHHGSTSELPLGDVLRLWEGRREETIRKDFRGQWNWKTLRVEIQKLSLVTLLYQSNVKYSKFVSFLPWQQRDRPPGYGLSTTLEPRYHVITSWFILFSHPYSSRGCTSDHTRCSVRPRVIGSEDQRLLDKSSYPVS